MSEMINANESQDMLWVFAKVKDSVCALDGRHVESIQLLDEPIRPLPGSDESHVGILRYRGNVIEAIDLRSMMGMPKLEQEQLAFEAMLEQRKQDHINWVNALTHSIESGEPFGLATDPHKCAFGKWYDHYQTDNQSVMFHLRKIDEPHQHLHATAVQMFSCSQEHSHCKRAECLKVTLERASEEYMPRVVALLEEAKEVFRNSYRKMAVVLSDGVCTRAVLVDEVLSAGALSSMTEHKGVTGAACAFADQSLVSHIAQSEEMAQQILVLNLNRLFETVNC